MGRRRRPRRRQSARHWLRTCSARPVRVLRATQSQTQLLVISVQRQAVLVIKQ